MMRDDATRRTSECRCRTQTELEGDVARTFSVFTKKLPHSGVKCSNREHEYIMFSEEAEH